jgi:hypothetical protein
VLVLALDVIVLLRLFGSNDSQEASGGGGPGRSVASPTSGNANGGPVAPPSTATSSAVSPGTAATPAGPTDTSAAPSAPRIRLEAPDRTVAALEIVELTGSYPGAAPGTTLNVQRRQNGAWVAFPLPTVVLPSRRYVAHVELGRVGAHRLRVVAPGSGDRSNTVTLRVR